MITLNKFNVYQCTVTPILVMMDSLRLELETKTCKIVYMETVNQNSN